MRTSSFEQIVRLQFNTESSKISMQVDEGLKEEIYTDMMKAILKFEIRTKQWAV